MTEAEAIRTWQIAYCNFLNKSYNEILIVCITTTMFLDHSAQENTSCLINMRTHMFC
jgi:hypothetical protein